MSHRPVKMAKCRAIQPEQGDSFEPEDFPETWNNEWAVNTRCSLSAWEISGQAQELRTASQELWLQLQRGLDLEEILNQYRAITIHA